MRAKAARCRAVMLAAALAASCAGCGITGGPPPVDYFTLEPPPRSADAAPAPAAEGDRRLIVETFQAPEIYQDDRIPVREGQRILHLKYGRWAGPPPEMVRRLVARALEETGRIRWVDLSTSAASDAECLLQGELGHLFLSAEADRWVAHLRARLRLLRFVPPSEGRPHRVDVAGEWTLQVEGGAPRGKGAECSPREVAQVVTDLSAKAGEELKKIAAEAAAKIEKGAEGGAR